MATNTTNYSLIKPTVGGDADDWGGYLNTNMDTIDGKLDDIEGKTGAGTLKYANAAKLATTSTGASVTGDLAVSNDATVGNDLTVTNDAIISNDLTVSNDATIAGDLNVTGTITASAFSGIYPVGSIYINATDGTNPATLLGFGTWVAFGAGRVPVGFDSTDTSFDTAEETGGSKDAIVVSHSHSVTDPGHTHNLSLDTYSGGGGGPASLDVNQYYNQTVTKTTASATTGISVNSAGSSGTNANLQPYITVYMWKRTA